MRNLRSVEPTHTIVTNQVESLPGTEILVILVALFLLIGVFVQFIVKIFNTLLASQHLCVTHNTCLRQQ